MVQAQIGIDIIEIERIKEAVSRYGEHFLKRIYTSRELDLCHGNLDSLAARFAGKESTMKALEGGMEAFSWHEIEILSETNGAPIVALYGRALKKAQALGLSGLKISLSHSRDNAISIVIGIQD
jgi:holo-[acyl-carrier protein] synthase